MQVSLIDHTPNPELAIAQAAAICYDAAIDTASCAKRMQRLLKLKHESPLRFAYATFAISGVSRVESHQHVRVAHAGILQRSQRYTGSSALRKIRPPSYAQASAPTMAMVHTAEAACLRAYQMLVADGVPLEDARYELQSGIETAFTMTGNFQMWLNWLRARTSTGAQWEIKAVAHEIGRQLSGIAPNVFIDFS
jgi:thymidylate synthase (FAD)